MLFRTYQKSYVGQLLTSSYHVDCVVKAVYLLLGNIDEEGGKHLIVGISTETSSFKISRDHFVPSQSLSS